MIFSSLLNSLFFWSIVSSILLGYSSLVKAADDDDPTPVLLVSLDGMRASSLDQHLKENPNSNFFRIIRKGVKAEYMTPIFPSLTFPNHWTLVTGVYAEVHGIVSNTVYDPNLNKRMNLLTGATATDPVWWNATEPIWVTARKKSLKTAASFWPGSESWPNTPDVFLHYTSSFTPYSRIDELMSWFKKFDLDFACIYFDEPDHEGHSFGPDTEEYKNKIKLMDKTIGYLLDSLEKNRLLDEINLIVVGDHGMESSPEVPESIGNYVNDSLIDHTRSVVSFVANMYPRNDNQVDELFVELEKVPNSKTYYKKDVPERYHYSKNDRIAPLVLLVDHGHLLADGVWAGTKGSHGYDNREETMRTIFMARGPNFKEGETMQGFDNINIQPLLCRLLNLNSRQSNGSAAVFEPYLRSIAIRVNTSHLLYAFSLIILIQKLDIFNL